MNDTVLDSNVIQVISKPRRDGVDDVVSRCVGAGCIRVVVDPDGGLVDEWRRTANPEVVEQLILRWKDRNCFAMSNRQSFARAKRESKATIKELVRRFGFRDQPMDKIVIAVAMTTLDQLVVSHDSDFVGGGIPAALKEELGVEVIKLDSLEGRFGVASPTAPQRRRTVRPRR